MHIVINGMMYFSQPYGRKSRMPAKVTGRNVSTKQQFKVELPDKVDTVESNLLNN